MVFLGEYLVIKGLSVCLPNDSKIEERQRNRLLDAGWLTNLPRFQRARSDHEGVFLGS